MTPLCRARFARSSQPPPQIDVSAVMRTRVRRHRRHCRRRRIVPTTRSHQRLVKINVLHPAQAPNINIYVYTYEYYFADIIFDEQEARAEKRRTSNFLNKRKPNACDELVRYVKTHLLGILPRPRGLLTSTAFKIKKYKNRADCHRPRWDETNAYSFSFRVGSIRLPANSRRELFDLLVFSLSRFPSAFIIERAWEHNRTATQLTPKFIHTHIYLYIYVSLRS